MIGQLSDSSCGTLKRGIKNDLMSGRGIINLNVIELKIVILSAKNLNTAAKLVKYCQDQPILKEVN